MRRSSQHIRGSRRDASNAPEERLTPTTRVTFSVYGDNRRDLEVKAREELDKLGCCDWPFEMEITDHLQLVNGHIVVWRGDVTTVPPRRFVAP